jgi:HAD superfamily hydrolase (TIGR01459 family)
MLNRKSNMSEYQEPELIRGLHHVADDYDAFILDIWGVLHDGIRPYDGVIECLKRLKADGKKIVLLTNSPNRAYRISEDTLNPMGIHKGAHYDDIISSGEAAWRALSAREGQSAYLFWRMERPTALEGHDMKLCFDVASADFMLASLLPAGSQEEDYIPALKEGVEKGLILYCANPDKVVNIGNELHLCAGALGDIYEELGGKVLWYGKPYAPIYEEAFEVLKGIEKSRICAVGDSLRTDVRGANKAGVDVLWNLVGIHWEELRHTNEHGENIAHPERLETSLREYEAMPKALLRGLKW